MIKVENIHKSFNGFEVLKGVTFEVAKGEILALIGRSGDGKSVLLKHLAGLMKPDRGRVWIDDKDMGSLSGKALEEVRSLFGFVFQNGALFDSLTIFENVAFPLREKTSLGEQEIKKKVISILDDVGLTGAENKYPAQISGGMVRRAGLARSLVRNPEIILFDEPTTGLDPIIGHAILNLIDSCHRQFGFTGILVTHEVPRAFEIVQKVAMLHEGEILIVAPPQEIVASNNPIVRQFITGNMEGPIQYR